MRFDFRNPGFAGTGMAERYSAALDMVEWADRLGFVSVVLSEHHGSSDGYLPSPLPLAAAVAARTEQVRIRIAAMVAPFHDPLRVAEDVAVVDLLSEGRVELVVTNGYVPAEFEMFGRSLSERPCAHHRDGADTQAGLDGRAVRVPRQNGSGHADAVPGGRAGDRARREQQGGGTSAARIADDFMPSSGEVWGFYRDERIALGKPDPGPFVGGDTSMFHIASAIRAGMGATRAVRDARGQCVRRVDGRGRARGGRGLRVGRRRRPVAGDGPVPGGHSRSARRELRAKGPFVAVRCSTPHGWDSPGMAWESLHLFDEDGARLPGGLGQLTGSADRRPRAISLRAVRGQRRS